MVLFTTTLLLQAFCETMKTELQQASSPLDASIEMILPGVQQWLDANRRQVLDLQSMLQESHEQIMRELESKHSAVLEQLGESMVVMGRSLMQQSTSVGYAGASSATTTSTNDHAPVH